MKRFRWQQVDLSAVQTKLITDRKTTTHRHTHSQQLHHNHPANDGNNSSNNNLSNSSSRKQPRIDFIYGITFTCIWTSEYVTAIPNGMRLWMYLCIGRFVRMPSVWMYVNICACVHARKYVSENIIHKLHSEHNLQTFTIANTKISSINKQKIPTHDTPPIRHQLTIRFYSLLFPHTRQGFTLPTFITPSVYLHKQFTHNLFSLVCFFVCSIVCERVCR